MHSSSDLPPDVVAALQRGDTIDAIKLLRATRGLGLKEAKDAVDAYARGAQAQSPPLACESSLPLDVVSALKQGNKIEAIRLLRARTGLGLKEAKDAVEAVPHESRSPADEDSPGKVTQSGAPLWWLAAACMAGLAAYAFLRGPG